MDILQLFRLATYVLEARPKTVESLPWEVGLGELHNKKGGIRNFYFYLGFASPFYARVLFFPQHFLLS